MKAFRDKPSRITQNFGHLSWLMKVQCWFIGVPQGFRKKSCGSDFSNTGAAVSVPSNLVEGCACNREEDDLRFLNSAFGSLKERHYQLK